MIITYTEEEQQHIAEIKNRFAVMSEELLKRTAPEDMQGRDSPYQVDYQKLYDDTYQELDDFIAQCQQKRFDPVQAAGADAILEHAIEQIQNLLPAMYADIEHMTSIITSDFDSVPAVRRDGVLYIKAEVAAEWMEQELRLHIAALEGDELRLHSLFSEIKRVIEGSNLTDGTVPAKARKSAALSPVRPKRFVSVTNTLMNYLAGAGNKKLINAGEQRLKVGERKVKSEKVTVTILADVIYRNAEIKDSDKWIPYSLSGWQYAVFEGITGIIEEAKSKKIIPVFTLDSLYEAIPGSGGRATPAMKEDLLQQIRTFKSIEFRHLDLTDEFRSRKIIGEDQTYSLEEVPMLSWHKERVDGIANRQTELFVIDSCVLYSYAEATKQIVSADKKYATIRSITKVAGKEGLGRPVNMTKERSTIVAYMLRRIVIMKHDRTEAKRKKAEYDRLRKKKPELPDRTFESFRDQYDTILMQTLFREAGTETTDKYASHRTRNFVFLVLDNFKMQGLIAGYRKRMIGRVVNAIEIIHADEQEPGKLGPATV